MGHVSIYHSLEGPALATADLGTSGESAFLSAFELITRGDGDAFVAGAIEEASALVELALAGLYGGAHPGPDARRARRGRGARARGGIPREGAWGASPRARSFRRLVDGRSPRRRRHPRSARRDARARRPRAAGRGVGVRVASTEWAAVPTRAVSPVAGEHEGLGATALVAAAALVHGGFALEVLVVGSTKGRGYAVTLEAPSQERARACERRGR